MKFFATFALFLVIVSVSLADHNKDHAKKFKGHEKESKSARHNRESTKAHRQDKYGVGWYFDDNYTSRLIINLIGQILKTLQGIRAEFPGNNNAASTEPQNETTDDNVDSPNTTGQVSIGDNEETPTTTTQGLQTAGDKSRPNYINSASRAHLAHAHGKAKNAENHHSKSRKSHTSKAKFHGNNKNHAKEHSKSRKEKSSHIQ